MVKTHMYISMHLRKVRKAELPWRTISTVEVPQRKRSSDWLVTKHSSFSLLMGFKEGPPQMSRMAMQVYGREDSSSSIQALSIDDFIGHNHSLDGGMESDWEPE